MATRPKAKSKRPSSLAVRPQMAAASRSNINLASLKATTIMKTKTALPAEIMAVVLDFLAVADLFSVARTSRRMQEMVYDDTRWVSKLRAMGVWDETEARQRVETAMQRKVDSYRSHHGSGLKNGKGHAGVNGVEGQTARRRPTASGKLIDSGFEEQVTAKTDLSSLRDTNSARATPASAEFTSSKPHNNSLSPLLVATLSILESVRSIRGQARQEYGKIHAALNPYYKICLTLSEFESRLSRDFQRPDHQATLLYQLKIFAQCDATSDRQGREATISEMSSNLESQAKMAVGASIAATYDEGALVIACRTLLNMKSDQVAYDTFINNSPLLKQRFWFGSATDCLEHAFEGQVNLNPSIDYFKQLFDVLQAQYRIIDRVFPQHSDITSQYLMAVGSRVIDAYVRPLITHASFRAPGEPLLKLFSGVFTHCQEMLFSINPPSGVNQDQHVKAVKEVLDIIFGDWLDAYLYKESEYFLEKVGEETRKWTQHVSAQEASAESFFMSNVSRQAAKNDFLQSFKNLLLSPANIIPSFSRNKPKEANSETEESHATSLPINITGGNNRESRSASPMPQDTVDNKPGDHNPLAAPSTEDEARVALANSRLAGINALLSVEVALEMVQYARSSIERIAPFVMLPEPHGEEARDACEKVFSGLIEKLGNEHIKIGFDKAIDQMKRYSADQATSHNLYQGVQPLVAFIELINIGDLMLQMVDVFYHKELAQASLVDPEDFLSPVTKGKKAFESMIDDLVTSGLQIGVDVIVSEAAYVLKTYRSKTDFDPAGVADKAKSSKLAPHAAAAGNPGAAEVEPFATEATLRARDILETHTKMIRGTTEKATIDLFDREVGLRFLDVLKGHIMGYRISPDGATRLISDMNRVCDYIATLKDKEVLAYYNALRALCQVYLVDGKETKEIAMVMLDHGRYEGKLKVEEVRAFVSLRTDWFAIRKPVEKQIDGAGCQVM